MMNTGIMADLNPSGTVLSYDQIKADRIRKGYCDTCRLDPYPVRCFEIKKRMGGTFTKKIPITKPGKVFDGICLRCNPLKDPDRPSKDKGHHRRQGSHDSNGNNSHHRRQGSYDSNNSKVNHLRQDSYDSYVNSHHRRQDSHDSNQHRRQGSHDSNGNNSHHRRQGSYDSNNAKVNHLRQDSYDSYINFHHRRQDSHDSDSNHGRHRRQGSYDSYINFHHRRQDSYDSNHRRHRRQGSYEYQQQHSNEYAQDHPLSLGVAGDRGYRRQGSRDDKYYTQQQQQATADPASPGGRDRDQDREASSEIQFGRMPASLEDVEDHDNDLQRDKKYRDGYIGGKYWNKQGGRNSFRALVEDEKLSAIPDLASLGLGGNATNEGAGGGNEEEPLDALAMLCVKHIEKNPQETVRFVPNTGTLLPNSELVLKGMSDEMSVMTLDTYFTGQHNTLMSASTQQSVRRPGMTTIRERSSGSNGSGLQRSMVSHQVKEPELGLPRAPKPPPEQAAAAAAASGTNDEGKGEGEAAGATSSSVSTSQQDLESYLESSPPHLLTLRDMVGHCTQAGDDPMAIEVVTQAMIINNATSMSMDLALFCLTTMWVLARKSDKNKHNILFKDFTFESIIEAMHIYLEKVEIQTRACGVLWSLSMDPNDRKHVVQKSKSILNAMQVHNENEALQVMALGALKVLSFDNISKSTLRTLGALSIVSEIMRSHVMNPTIQSEGCVILGNLAVDDANQFVAPVTENEVEAIIRGILAHVDSLEVHEAACFTLMSLASSAANVELIRNNEMSRVSLELAFEKHPDDVGVNILILWKRLKFNSPNQGFSLVEHPPINYQIPKHFHGNFGVPDIQPKISILGYIPTR